MELVNSLFPWVVFLRSNHLLESCNIVSAPNWMNDSSPRGEGWVVKDSCSCSSPFFSHTKRFYLNKAAASQTFVWTKPNTDANIHNSESMNTDHRNEGFSMLFGHRYIVKNNVPRSGWKHKRHALESTVDSIFKNGRHSAQPVGWSGFLAYVYILNVAILNDQQVLVLPPHRSSCTSKVLLTKIKSPLAYSVALKEAVSCLLPAMPMFSTQIFTPVAMHLWEAWMVIISSALRISYYDALLKGENNY